MSGKGSKLYCMFFLKFQRCHKGAFLEANPYNLGKFNTVKRNRPNADLNTVPSLI